MRILWLEDHEDLIEAEKAILERAGHTVTLCRFVSEAYDALEQSPLFDFVIIDIHMPESEDQFPKAIRSAKRKLGLDAMSRMNGLAFALYLVKNHPNLQAAFYSIFDELPITAPDLQNIPIFNRTKGDYRNEGILNVIKEFRK